MNNSKFIVTIRSFSLFCFIPFFFFIVTINLFLFNNKTSAVSSFDNLVTPSPSAILANNSCSVEHTYDWANVFNDSSYWSQAVGASFSEVSTAYNIAISNGSGWAVSQLHYIKPNYTSHLGNYYSNYNDKWLVVTFTADPNNQTSFVNINGFDYLYLHNTNTAFKTYRVYLAPTADCSLGVVVAFGQSPTATPATFINDGFALASINDNFTRQPNFINSPIVYPNDYEGALISDTPPEPKEYHPVKPVASYSVEGFRLKADCLKTRSEYETNDVTISNCNIFLDDSIADKGQNNLRFFTGDVGDPVTQNAVDNDIYSDNHIKATSLALDSQYCDFVACHFEYIFEKFGTFYLKATVTPDGHPDLTSVAVTPIKIDGSFYNGDTITGEFVPDIYQTCNLNSLLPSDIFDFVSCNIKNVQTWFTKTITELFIPNWDAIGSSLDFTADKIRSKFGFLFYPVDFITEFINTANSAVVDPNCNLAFGSVFNGHSVNYNTCLFEEKIPSLFTFFQIVIRSILFIFVIHLLYKKLINILHGDNF